MRYILIVMFICGLALFTTSVLYFSNSFNVRIALIDTINAQAPVPAKNMSPADVLQDDISWIIGLAGGIILIVVSVVQGIRWLHGSITKQVKTEIDVLKNTMDSDKKLIDQRLDFQNTVLAEIKSTTSDTSKKIDVSMTKLETKIDVIEEKKNVEHRDIYLHLQKHDDAIAHIRKEIDKNQEDE